MEINNKIIELNNLVEKDNWIKDLALFIRKAYNEDKLIKSHYQQIIFTPLALANEIMQGRFRWGLDNWMMIDKTPNIYINHKDPK